MALFGHPAERVIEHLETLESATVARAFVEAEAGFGGDSD